MWKYICLSLILVSAFLVHPGLGSVLMCMMIVMNVIIQRCGENDSNNNFVHEVIVPFWPLSIGSILLMGYVLHTLVIKIT